MKTENVIENIVLYGRKYCNTEQEVDEYLNGIEYFPDYLKKSVKEAILNKEADFKIIIQKQELKLSPSQQLGEDIRAAKAIFEDRFGEQTCVDVNLWMDFANDVKTHLQLSTLQEVVSHLNLKIRKY
jgi:hypothetical protein